MQLLQRTITQHALWLIKRSKAKKCCAVLYTSSVTTAIDNASSRVAQYVLMNIFRNLLMPCSAAMAFCAVLQLISVHSAAISKKKLVNKLVCACSCP